MLDQNRLRELLKICRERADLTQGDIARLKFVSQSKISMIESGERPITLEEALDWVELTGQWEFFLMALAEDREVQAITEATQNKMIVETMKQTLVGMGA